MVELLKKKLKSNRELTVRPRVQRTITPAVTLHPVPVGQLLLNMKYYVTSLQDIKVIFTSCKKHGGFIREKGINPKQRWTLLYVTQRYISYYAW